MRTAQLATVAIAVVVALAAPLACKKGRRAGGLEVDDMKVGSGAVATAGKMVTVHYTGWLLDGKKFDSSYDHDPPAPISFVLGTGRVIKGWDMGLEGMRVGGKRKLTIPAALAYGERGTPGGPIPPSSTLVFDVDLVGVQ